MNVLGMCSTSLRSQSASTDAVQYKANMKKRTNVENKGSVTVGPLYTRRNSKLKVAIPGEHTHRRCPIHVGKMYELDDGRFGTCMFLGRTLFKKKGLWVGLQLENAKGKHNGTVHGKKYFLCREDRGVFVRPCRIKRLVTEISKGNINPLDKKVIKDPRRNRYIRKETIMDLVKLTTPSFSRRELMEFDRRNSHRQSMMDLLLQKSESDTESTGWKPADYDIEPDHENSFKPKTLYTEKELHSRYGEECDYKPTVSEIMSEGFPLNWQKASFQASDLTDHGGLFYPRSKLHKHLNEKADHKPGSIETGHADGYSMPEYPGRQYSIDRDQYFLHYPKSKLHENDGEQADRKPGSIEIGKSDYITAQYNVDTSIEKRQYGLYHPINELHKRDGEHTPHKLGAIDTGRAKGFHQAVYSVDWDPITLAQYGLFYNPTELQKNWTRKNSRRGSNVSSIPEGKRYTEKAGGWYQSGQTPGIEESSCSTLFSNVSSLIGEWPESKQFVSAELLSAAAPSTEPFGHTLPVLNENEAVSTDELKRRNAVVSDERDAAREDNVKDEVNAYIPKRFPRRSPRTKVPHDMSRRNLSFDISKYRNVNSSHIDTEEDTFTNDILNLARSSFGHRRERSRSRTQSLFIAPWFVNQGSLSSEDKLTMV